MQQTRGIKEQKKGIEESKHRLRRETEWKQLRREERIDVKRRQDEKLGVVGVDSRRE